MLILSTSEDVRAHEELVSVLYASEKIEDQMVGTRLGVGNATNCQ